MNGVGVPSVKCQISNRSKKVLHIQFEGQYLPQYNVVLSVTGLILLWKFQYHWCTFSVGGMNTSFMNGVGGGPFCKVPNIHQCIIGQYYSVYSSIICAQFTKIIITMIHTVICHVCHLWIEPVSLSKYRQGLRQSG